MTVDFVQIVNILLLLFHAVLLIFFLSREPLAFTAYFFLFFHQVTLYISVVYLDQGGIWMRELGRYSLHGVSSLIVFLFYTISTWVIVILIRVYKGKLIRLLSLIESRRISNVYLWIIGFYAIVTILIGHVIVSGSPLWVKTVGKNTVWEVAKIPQLRYLSSQVSVIALFSGIFLLNNVVKRKPVLFQIPMFGIYLLLLAYLVLLGHKFGQLIIITVLFFMPLLTYYALLKKFPIKKVTVLGVIFVSLLWFPINNYFTSVYGEGTAIDMIQERAFAMQGQLAHVAINDYISNSLPFDINQLALEFRAILGLNTHGRYVGMQYLMSQYMPPSYFAGYLKNKVNLAGGYIAMLLVLFNSLPLALLVHVVFVSAFFLVGFMLTSSILKYDLLLVFVYLKLYFSFYTYYVQAYTTAIINSETLIYIFLLFMIMVVRKMYPEKKVGRLNTAVVQIQD